MKKDRINLVLGIILIILPLTGLPREFKNIGIYSCGVLIVLISLASIYFRHKLLNPKLKSEIFEESKPVEQIPEKMTEEVSAESEEDNQDSVL